MALVFYSKSGIRDRFDAIREMAGEGREVPTGVRPEYMDHMISEEKEATEMKDGSVKHVWIQHAKPE